MLVLLHNYKIVGSHPYHMAGVLCGSCRNGYGVSVLLNKCVTCHDASGMLIAVLSEYQLCIVVESMWVHGCSYIFSSVLVDAVVLTGLMLLMNTFPIWLYPCVFYLQVGVDVSIKQQLILCMSIRAVCSSIFK